MTTIIWIELLDDHLEQTPINIGSSRISDLQMIILALRRAVVNVTRKNTPSEE